MIGSVGKVPLTTVIVIPTRANGSCTETVPLNCTLRFAPAPAVCKPICPNSCGALSTKWVLQSSWLNSRFAMFLHQEMLSLNLHPIVGIRQYILMLLECMDTLPLSEKRLLKLYACGELNYFL